MTKFWHLQGDILYIVTFWDGILNVHKKESFMCPEYGPGPDLHCMDGPDGVCIAISVKL